MSAKELIKQVATLPPQERTLFDQLLRGLEHDAGSQGPGNRTQWPDFGQRLQDMYGDKVAPDSQSIIDEGRGDS
jgi:hypothetical protein